MAINIGQELERLYNANKTKQQSLTERLSQMDQYSGQVNPAVRAEMTDFSDRPAGYNPLQDIQSSIEFSERSRDYRSGASEDLARTETTGLSLLSELDALAQRASSGSKKLSPEEELALELKKQAALKDIKDGKLKLNEKGELVMSKGSNVSDTSKNILNLTDQLLKKNTKPITGLLQVESMIPGTKAKQTQALFDQLKGIMSLENRTLLKGSGAISDYESKVLERAASSLNRDLSDEDFRTTLTQIKKDLQEKTGTVPKQTSEKNKQNKQIDTKKDPLGIL